MKKNERENHLFYQKNAPFPKNRFISVSDRFVDMEGKPIDWEIKSLRQREQEEILQGCRQKRENDKHHFDTMEYEGRLLAKAVVFPDLEDAALQDSYGVLGVRALLEKMLTAGEYQRILLQVMDISQ